MTHPSEFGIDHSEWRPGQLESIRWIANNKKPVLIVQAPTGIGKTAVGAALSRYGSVRSLTATLALQEQYTQYGFEPIFGMSHYQCAFNPLFDASLCAYIDNMYQCPKASVCEYLIRRKAVREAEKQSLSYAYWMAAEWPRKNPTKFLYADEAHNIPDILKNDARVEIDNCSVHFPTRAHDGIKLAIAVDWVEKNYLMDLKIKHNKLSSVHPSKRSYRQIVGLKNLTNEIQQITNMIRSASAFPGDFVVALVGRKLIIAPIVSRYFFKNRFDFGAHQIILTSATIGNPKVFVKNLGLTDSQWDSYAVPSPFSPKQMPIYYPNDAPKLNNRSSEKTKNKWASGIARIIKECDPAWNGLIHVASYSQAEYLAQNLSSFGIDGNRCFIPRQRGTNNKRKEWLGRLNKRPNSICISPAFWEGVDAGGTQINIIAKVPFSALGDPASRALADRYPDLYRLSAALMMEQAAGRVRRGREEDYEKPGEPMRKMVAIADANFEMVRHEMSEHFSNCLTQL